MEEQATPPASQETIFDETEMLNEGYDKHVRQARNVIFIVAGVQFIAGIYQAYIVPGATVAWLVFGIFTFLAGIFLALGFWAKKMPYSAIITTLIVYGGLLLLDFFTDPATALRGFIVKGIIIFYLAKGLQDAKEAQQMRKALGKIKNQLPHR